MRPRDRHLRLSLQLYLRVRHIRNIFLCRAAPPAARARPPAPAMSDVVAVRAVAPTPALPVFIPLPFVVNEVNLAFAPPPIMCERRRQTRTPSHQLRPPSTPPCFSQICCRGGALVSAAWSYMAAPVGVHAAAPPNASQVSRPALDGAAYDDMPSCRRRVVAARARCAANECVRGDAVGLGCARAGSDNRRHDGVARSGRRVGARVAVGSSRVRARRRAARHTTFDVTLSSCCSSLNVARYRSHHVCLLN